MNAPLLAVVPPIAPGAANVAPFKLAAFKLATLVVDATVNGAVPVAIVEVTVVKRPVDAVVAPMLVLLIVLAPLGFIVTAPPGLIATVPAPVGEILTAAPAPFKLTVLDAESVVNEPAAAAVPPIAGGLAK